MEYKVVTSPEITAIYQHKFRKFKLSVDCSYNETKLIYLSRVDEFGIRREVTIKVIKTDNDIDNLLSVIGIGFTFYDQERRSRLAKVLYPIARELGLFDKEFIPPKPEDSSTEQQVEEMVEEEEVVQEEPNIEPEPNNEEPSNGSGSGDQSESSDSEESEDSEETSDSEESEDSEETSDSEETKESNYSEESKDKKESNGSKESKDSEEINDSEDQNKDGDDQHTGSEEPTGDQNHQGDKNPSGSEEPTGDQNPRGSIEPKGSEGNEDLGKLLDSIENKLNKIESKISTNNENEEYVVGRRGGGNDFRYGAGKVTNLKSVAKFREIVYPKRKRGHDKWDKKELTKTLVKERMDLVLNAKYQNSLNFEFWLDNSGSVSEHAEYIATIGPTILKEFNVDVYYGSEAHPQELLVRGDLQKKYEYIWSFEDQVKEHFANLKKKPDQIVIWSDFIDINITDIKKLAKLFSGIKVIFMTPDTENKALDTSYYGYEFRKVLNLARKHSNMSAYVDCVEGGEFKRLA